MWIVNVVIDWQVGIHGVVFMNKLLGTESESHTGIRTELKESILGPRASSKTGDRRGLLKYPVSLISEYYS